jgi:hypothetical protein
MTKTKEQEQKMMILTTNVIMTFEDNTQKFFNHRTNIVNDKRLSEYGLEKMLITQIVHHSDNLKKIVKLSLCVYAKDNDEDVMNDNKILSIFKSKNGKYYFQPDQRCEVVAELCKEYPEIAKDVLPLKEYMKIHYPSKLEELIKKCKELCFNHKPKPIDPDELHEDHKSSFYNKLERELA